MTATTKRKSKPKKAPVRAKAVKRPRPYVAVSKAWILPSMTEKASALPTEIEDAPDLVFPPGTFTKPEPRRTFWQWVWDFVRGKR